jgi:hypothetical protein
LIQLRRTTLLPEGVAQILAKQGIQLAAIIKQRDFPEIL